MTDPIHNYLTQLYTPEEAATTHEQLMKLMEAARARIVPPESRELFSQEDVMLITYGNTLHQDGASPLEILRQFAEERLHGIINAIHLLPFYPYSSDDGFAVKDYYAVDPDLGDWQDIELLQQNFNLMFDAVFNHMSVQSEWFRAFLADDPAYAGLFRAESPDIDLSSVTRPRTSPLLTPFQKPNGQTVHIWTTFSPDQADFDVRTPGTLLRLVEILLFYVEKGARYIRLDAIAFLWKKIGTSSIHLDETHIIIQLMRAVLDAVAPHVILITETNVLHQENISYFGDGYNEAQLVYNFSLPPLLLHTLLSGNADKLRDWVNTLTTPSEHATFFNFTASHDGIGVRPVEGILSANELQRLVEQTEARGGRVSYKRNQDGSQSPYELNIAYIDALAGADEADELLCKRFLASQAIALGLAGIPAIYIHSLLGSRNDIEGMLRAGYNRAINRAQISMSSAIDALDDTRSWRATVFNQYTALIKERIRHRAFHPYGHQEALTTETEGVFALLRISPDESERILMLVNVTDQGQSVDLSKHMTQASVDLLSGAPVSNPVILAPYQMYWLALS